MSLGIVYKAGIFFLAEKRGLLKLFKKCRGLYGGG
jgi:hypothetical protein